MNHFEIPVHSEQLALQMIQDRLERVVGAMRKSQMIVRLVHLTDLLIPEIVISIQEGPSMLSSRFSSYDACGERSISRILDHADALICRFVRPTFRIRRDHRRLTSRKGS